ncbi:MAG: hypothetical protein LBF72_01070 [Holosporales bacterium]|nr:hypothetical protein [Holosporales bacterium]
MLNFRKLSVCGLLFLGCGVIGEVTCAKDTEQQDKKEDGKNKYAKIPTKQLGDMIALEKVSTEEQIKIIKELEKRAMDGDKGARIILFREHSDGLSQVVSPDNENAVAEFLENCEDTISLLSLGTTLLKKAKTPEISAEKKKELQQKAWDALVKAARKKNDRAAHKVMKLQRKGVGNLSSEDEENFKKLDARYARDDNVKPGYSNVSAGESVPVAR